MGTPDVQATAPPIAQPAPQPVIPVPSIPPPITPAKPKNTLVTVLIVLIVLLSLEAAGYFAYQYLQKKQQAAITTFEACSKAPGSVIEAMYPPVCVTRDGKQFTQPLTPEEQQNLLPPSPTPDTKVSQQVLGIQLTQCCSCPTMVDASQIGTNGWVVFDQEKNYTSLRPSTCSAQNIGVCAPCPALKRGNNLDCQYNGKTYKNGEQFPDKCNSCTCESGQVACTAMACL